MDNEYAYKLAKALVWPELTVEFAADVINGYVYGSEIWAEVCTLTGGWCNDAAVFLAWDKMGRPDESEYLELNYDMERDPARRRAIVAKWDDYQDNGGDPNNECDWRAFVIDNAVSYLEDVIF